METRTKEDETESAELTNLINNRKISGIHKLNMEKVEKGLRNGGSLKRTKRRLGY